MACAHGLPSVLASNIPDARTEQWDDGSGPGSHTSLFTNCWNSFIGGIFKLLDRWHKCILLNGDSVQKWILCTKIALKCFFLYIPLLLNKIIWLSIRLLYNLLWKDNVGRCSSYQCRHHHQHIIIIVFSNLYMKHSGIQMHYCSVTIQLWQPIMTHRTNICSHSVSNQ